MLPLRASYSRTWINTNPGFYVMGVNPNQDRLEAK